MSVCLFVCAIRCIFFGEVFFTGDRHADTHTDGHRDSMTELAQWADSVKIVITSPMDTLYSKWFQNREFSKYKSDYK